LSSAKSNGQAGSGRRQHQPEGLKSEHIDCWAGGDLPTT